jgi:hypothetical protein
VRSGRMSMATLGHGSPSDAVTPDAGPHRLSWTTVGATARRSSRIAGRWLEQWPAASSLLWVTLARTVRSRRTLTCSVPLVRRERNSFPWHAGHLASRRMSVLDQSTTLLVALPSVGNT